MKIYCRQSTGISGTIVAVLFILTAALPPAPGSGQKEADRIVEVVLDASGSTAGKISGGEVKIEAAKKAVEDLTFERKK